MTTHSVILSPSALRLRILHLSQKTSALHIAPAFSCIELVVAAYEEFFHYKDFDFIVSKGHGYLAQLVALESLGVIDSIELEKIGSKESIYGGHPDRGTPGIIASTGSLGHGLGIAVGISLGKKMEKSRNGDGAPTVVLISDGELQEGSTWESILNAPALGATNLILLIDNNDMQTMANTSISHPGLYPIKSKMIDFGWDCFEVDGHSVPKITAALNSKRKEFPLCIIGKTVKGKGVSYMENSPIWHYRSPSVAEYEIAKSELIGQE